MFERRPLFGALIVLTLVVTIWHMSLQEADSSSSSSGTTSTVVGVQGDTQGMQGPSLLTHYSPHLAVAPPSSSYYFYALSKGGGGGVVGDDASATTVDSWNQSSALGSLVNPVERLPKDDYTNLIDLKDFRFTINFSNCSSDSSERIKRDSLKSDERRSPLVLVLVHSAPTNWYKRNTIRDTWGQHDPRAKLVFLLGAVNSSILQRRIEQENRMYDDIVQGSFLDAYRNMTYKHVMALKWFTYHCPEAKYILKADDDVFVNTPALYDVLETATQRRRLLFCQEIRKAPVKRTHRSKWYVSIPEYRNKYYPSHCPGYSIIYTPDVAFLLYREAQQQPYFWIDDVHLTGTIAQRINATITPTGSMLLNKSQKDAIIENKLNATEQLFFFTTPDLRQGEIRQLWKAVTAARRSSSSSSR